MSDRSSVAGRPPIAGGNGSALPAPPLGRLYDIAGRRLMLHRSGSGGPAVVFLPGAGMVGLDYLNMHNRVAELTTTVLYDRAGTGWSEAAVLPRTAAEVTDELLELLRAADVPGPYLLVGHSMGAAHARHLAQRFPGEVVGLLLLDPFHEDLHARVPQEVRDRMEELESQEWPEPTEEQVLLIRGQMAPLFANWPETVRDQLIEHHLRVAWRTGRRESENIYDEVAEELRHAPALPDLPLIVITALGRDATQEQLWPEHVLREIHRTTRALHADLASSVPRGEQRILDDAGHGFLHEDRPDAVLQAIVDLLHRVER